MLPKHEHMTCNVLPASKMRIFCGLYHWTLFGAMSATHSTAGSTAHFVHIPWFNRPKVKEAYFVG